ncbi:MAG: hypothetical protein H7144_13590 [Burkholderiales bacterium]|nr:hypothetical protein [Phycisphaerae bacterium]
MTTLTLQNVPDNVVAALERAANARSVTPSVEAVEWLERAVVVEDRITAMRLLDDIRRTRDKLASAGVWLTDEDISDAKRHRYE